MEPMHEQAGYANKSHERDRRKNKPRVCSGTPHDWFLHDILFNDPLVSYEFIVVSDGHSFSLRCSQCDLGKVLSEKEMKVFATHFTVQGYNNKK